MIKALVANGVVVGVADVVDERGTVEYGHRKSLSIDRSRLFVKGEAALVSLPRIGYEFVRFSQNERHCFLTDEHGQLENHSIYDL